MRSARCTTFFLCCSALACLVAFHPEDYSTCPVEVPKDDNSSSELKGVEATLELVTDSAEIGETSTPVIFVRQTIHNGTPHRLWVARSPLYEANCVRLLEPGKKTAKLSDDGRRFAKASKRRGHSSVRIASKGKHEIIFPLSRHFDLLEPGSYTVMFSTKYSIFNDPKVYWTRPEPLAIVIAPDGSATPSDMD